MSEPYEEILSGEVWLRLPPGPRHELICARLHAEVASRLAGNGTLRQLAPRSVIEVLTGTMLRPDLALVNSATGRLWLAAEVVNSSDHRPDTVTKKALYEDIRLPRLWMIDPRYDNVEVYATGDFGLALKGILAGAEHLTERMLPGLGISMTRLFADAG